MYVTSFAPSPKFLFATYECKKLREKNGCCLFLDENASGLTTRLKQCDFDKTTSRLPVDWTLVHSVRRNESGWFVITGSKLMSFSCLCRWRIQSFLNDARREAHNEVGLHVDAFIQAYVVSLFTGRLLNI